MIHTATINGIAFEILTEKEECNIGWWTAKGVDGTSFHGKGTDVFLIREEIQSLMNLMKD